MLKNHTSPNVRLSHSIAYNGIWLVVRCGIWKTKLENMLQRLFEKLKPIKPRQPHLPQTNVRRSVSHCEKCGSKNVGNTYSCYTRGYNELCQQACGDRGAFCNDCCHVTFVQSLEDYKKSLPNWCRAYGY